jgi:Tfp pilus assembly PilM family ATPase
MAGSRAWKGQFMFGSWFNSKTATIGIDVGRSAIKLAQIEVADDQTPRLVASASIEVPAAQRATAAGPLEALAQSIDATLEQNGFRGRRAIFGLPATYVHIDRVRLAATLAEDEIHKSVAFECTDRLPFPPSRAKLRHHLAGQVYENDEQRHEVIVMAVRQDVTERMLSIASKAKLEIVGLRPEPMALAEAFGRDKNDRCRAIVDIGHGATRLYVARGARIEFARSIGIGWQHMGPRPAAAEEKGEWEATSTAGTTAGVITADARATTTTNIDAIRRLARDLSLSLHYHAETFPASPVAELVFVGGASLHRRTCQQIAAALGLQSRPADLVALSPDAPAKPELAVAICLSLSTPDGGC